MILADACTVPNSKPYIVNVEPAVFPDSARSLNLREVVVDAEVVVDETGRVVSIKILKSSSNIDIDQAVMRAARQSTYAPGSYDCAPAGGQVFFHVDMTP